MSIKAGNTFLDKEEIPHLWIVVAGPDADGKVIIANLTSVKGRDDRTTVCKPGDHPFIDKESVIAYKYAMHVEVAALQSGLDNGKIVAREDCSAQFLKAVADGLLKSDSTSLAVQNAYVTILRS